MDSLPHADWVRSQSTSDYTHSSIVYPTSRVMRGATSLEKKRWEAAADYQKRMRKLNHSR